jgi:hypothetical protein
MLTIKKFKQPDAENDKKLKEIYDSLNEKNRAYVDKRTNVVINTVVIGGVMLLLLALGLSLFIMVSGMVDVGLLCLIFALYPIYLISNANSWKKALPHQKIMLIKDEVVFLLNKQTKELK